MLTISKPTIFGPDGLAARGQCNQDSPGWQLRWFDRQQPPTLVWQGAFKTCRHLQSSCAAATSFDEAKKMVDDLLSTDAFTHFTTKATDLYPAAKEEPTQSAGAARKKKKKRRH